VSQDKVLLSPKEFGQRFGVGRTKVNQMLQEGQIKSFKLGRLRKIPMDAIADFIEKQLAAQGNGQEK
jgi:excisionase family DNA binding protein